MAEISTRKNFVEFEHALRYLLCEVENIVNEDLYALDDVKQTVIVFAMKTRFAEANSVFLNNMKHEFYSGLNSIEQRHPELKNKIKVIKSFMEEFYFCL